jgi:hypothetical protein
LGKLRREGVETDVVLDGLEVCRQGNLLLDLRKKICLGELEKLVCSRGCVNLDNFCGVLREEG